MVNQFSTFYMHVLIVNIVKITTTATLKIWRTLCTFNTINSRRKYDNCGI